MELHRLRLALTGKTLLEPLSPATQELYRMYRWCKLFGGTPDEYERRSHHEVTRMLAIDDTYNAATRE